MASGFWPSGGVTDGSETDDKPAIFWAPYCQTHPYGTCEIPFIPELCGALFETPSSSLGMFGTFCVNHDGSFADGF